MGSQSFKTVYIIAMLVASSGLVIPGPANNASAQVSLPSVTDDLTRIPSDLEVDRRLRPQLEQRTKKSIELAEEWIDTAVMTVDETAAQAVDVANGVLRELQVGQDPAGADIEERVIVVLVASEQLAGLTQAGYEIIAERDMTSLGMTLLTLRLPLNADLPEAVQELRDANPGTAIDYNHLYDFTAGATQVVAAVDAEKSEHPSQDISDNLRVGIIDSAVMQEHRALAEITVVASDFATSPGLRPQTHGTAVASLVAKSADQQVTVYSASVFFQLPNRAPGATAESLVAALDWLLQEDVDVINMSLAGPGNELLGAAIARLVQLDEIVVAAVGNNGPKGEPLYPAAYDGVIGVTAVNRKNKIFRYANRGEQVEFAARGVDVKVADSVSGGWRIESGTSMASPHVAVIVGQLLRAEAVQPKAVASWLMANAEDLGRRGFDPVYGHGLITQPPIVLSEN